MRRNTQNNFARNSRQGQVYHGRAYNAGRGLAISNVTRPYDLPRNSAPLVHHLVGLGTPITQGRTGSSSTMEITKATEQEARLRNCKYTNLDNRYGKIGISAVAAAVCHQGGQRHVTEAHLEPQRPRRLTCRARRLSASRTAFLIFTRHDNCVRGRRSGCAEAAFMSCAIPRDWVMRGDPTAAIAGSQLRARW